MNADRLISIVAFFLCVSCSPRVTSHLSGQYGPLPADEEVTVLPVGAAVPAAAERLGDVVVKDSGFSLAKNGTFSAVLDLAKQEARGAGGNVLLLTDHRKPDFSSTIHRIRADVYRADSAAIVPVAEFIPSPALVDTVYTQMNVRVKMPKTFVVGLWGGGGFRTNRMDPQLTGKEREYASALRWGFDFGADAVYYFGNWGLGVRYSSLRAHHRDDMVVSTSEGQRTGMLDTHTNIWFLGPVAGFREPFGDNGNCLYSIIGVGYMGYKQEQVFRSYYPIFIKGGTAGFLVELGADFRLTDHVFFCAGLSYYQGALYSYQESTGGMTKRVELDDEGQEGLNYLALNLGIHWRFGPKAR